MRVAFSRWTIFSALTICLSIGAASGCRSTASGWSAPSWLSWNNWGKSSTPSSLAATKPSTQMPKPSAGTTPQAVASVGAGTTGSSPYGNNPSYASAAAAYPTGTGSTGYGTQAAAAYQQANAAGQVQPTVGYQTGPYGMSSSAAGGAAGGYAATGYGGATNAAAGYGAAPSAGYGTAANTGYGAAGTPP